MSYSHLLNWALNKPKQVYAIILTMVLVACAMLPFLQIDTDPENMLDQHAPARVFHNQIKQQFVMHDMVVVGLVSDSSIYSVENLTALHTLSTYIQSLDNVILQDFLALDVVDNISQLYDSDGNNQGIKFSYLMKQAPESGVEASAIQTAVKRLPLLENTLVSQDNKAAAIYIPLTSKDVSYQVAEQIRQYADNMKTDLAVHITGLPIAEDQFGYEMFVQMGVAAPLAGLAIFILLWYFFRNLQLVIAPMVVAMATVLIIMGALIGMGYTVHIMSSMIAIFLMPIAVVDSVHILSEFADRYRAGDKVSDVLGKVMKHLYKPMLFTSLTSSVGFFSLLLTPIPPVKVFGAFIGAGILLAFAFTVLFIPAYISRMSPQAIEHLHDSVARLEQKGLLSNVLVALGRFARTKGKLIIAVAVALLVFSVVGISRIQINDNPVNWFKQDHQIRVADKVLNEHFAGTYDAWLVSSSNADNSQDNSAIEQQLSQLSEQGLDVSLLLSHLEQRGIDQDLLFMIDDLSFTADSKFANNITSIAELAERSLNKQKVFTQPEMLEWQSQLQAKLIESGLVGKVNSITEIVKTVNRELQSGDDKDYAIPSSSDAVAQTLLQYQSSHRPQDLWHFVNTDYTQSLMWLQMVSGDNQHMSAVVEWVETYIAANPAPIDLEVNWAGKSYLNVIWQDLMVSGMLSSLLSSFVIVFLMMVLLFRSLKYGLLAMLPLTFTITAIYGLIGWGGKAYDMPIAVLSALTLGLSIDFAIHFLQRLRELRQELGSMQLALEQMCFEPSKAISRNAIVIAIGFTPLLLSPLVPYITVGFFLASIMAVSAMVTLVLLPSILSMLDRS
ncbi:MMPL family transporter [Thalassotalea ponticola]|uniref:efflux RND transporter permease subunit n=1 Tax=Thalassotalea ponticola TaxID=1523392 RepID=UPI0025B39E17|nr:MMPL family transporter [Thalassotalea ponticola]MDN3651824.1 MMPL family transporter [Thalassotalea ponticola]